MVAIVTDAYYRMSPALIRELGAAGVEVVACQRGDAPAVGAASRWCRSFRRLPEEDYARALWELCREIGESRRCRPALLPVGAETLAMLARERSRFDEVCGLCIPLAEQLALFNSKRALGALARTLGVPVPESYACREGESGEAFAARVPLPCVVKPDWGEGLGLRAGERYVIARSREEAREALERFRRLSGAEPVVQEYLPGTGLGCSVLAENGRVLASVCHRRVRELPVTGGPSSCCESVLRPELEDCAARLTARTGYTGLVMFEFREDAAGRPRLLEANPRVWGTFPLTRAAGTGMALLWCALAWNRGGPEQAVPLPEAPRSRPVRMQFAVSDLAAGLGYVRAGQPGRGLGALKDLLDPRVRGGVFEWGDPGPGLAYLRGLVQRRRER